MTRKNKNKLPAPQPYPYPQQPVYAMPPPAPTDMHSVSISVLSSHGATVAKVSYASAYSTGIPVYAAGHAKREPGDDYDAETGRLLATSRALEILAGKLRRKANSRIRSADTIRRHRAEAREKRELAEKNFVGGSSPLTTADPALLYDRRRMMKGRKVQAMGNEKKASVREIEKRELEELHGGGSATTGEKR